MTTIDVLIPYQNPVYHETVAAESVDGEIWELREHAGFCPLAPGDRVRVDSANNLTEIVFLEPTYVYGVFCHLPAGVTFGMAPSENHPALVKLAKLEEEWRRDTQVTRTTAFTFLLSTPNPQWFEDKVANHPYVEYTDLLRIPEATLDLSELLAHPAFHGDAGPISGH